MICVSDYEMKIILDIIKTYAPYCSVLAFGSRYKWTPTDSSDLDLAFVQSNNEKLSLHQLGELREAFSESNLPYKVDVLDYHGISESFRGIIDAGYEVIYKAEQGNEQERLGLKLGDFAIIEMGQSPSSSDCNNIGNGIPLLNGPTEFGYQHPYPVQWTTDGRKKAQTGDILFCVRGSTTGRMNWANQPYAIGRGIAAIRHTEPSLNYFVWSVLKWKLDDLLNIATGSTFPNVSRDMLKSLEIPEIGIVEQRIIADTLSAIDNKIVINTKINHHLEQMSQAIFKSWFVDFEPFGGEMPEDWNEGTFSDIVLTTFGGDWGKEAPTGNNTQEVYCIRGADIPDVNNGNKGKMPTRFILPKNYTAKKLAVGDIVVEISGGSPTQSTGRCALITQSLLDRYDKGMVCTNFCRAIKPTAGYSSFVYFYWKYLYNEKVYFGYENGTTGIKNLDISGFLEKEPIVIPSAKVISQFSATVEMFVDAIFANGMENERLENIRDALLPRLMSGEITVDPSKTQPYNQ